MKVLWGHDAEIATWVGWRIPLTAKRLTRDPTCQPFGPCVAAGIIDSEGRLIAGVVYHNYDVDCASVEMSFAADSPRWLTRGIICTLLRYAFSTAHCNRITGVTPRKATSARRFLDKFGFRREGVATDGFGDDDAVISRLLKREWQATKWAKPLPERRKPQEDGHGQKRRQRTPSA